MLLSRMNFIDHCPTLSLHQSSVQGNLSFKVLLGDVLTQPTDLNEGISALL